MWSLLMLNSTMTIIFIMIKHPLSMGTILMIQTILISLMNSLIFKKSIFSLILFIIMIGGMMILFMYMTSIASNEKFKMISMNWILLITVLMTIIIMYMNKNYNTSMEMNKLMVNSNSMMNMMFIKFWMKPLFSSMIFMFIYMLICMVATIKITMFNSGPLRHMY